MTYILNILLNGFAKIASLAISVFIAKEGGSDVVSAYLLIYTQCIFSCYFGSLGILQVWPAIYNNVSSWRWFGLFKKINNWSVFFVSATVFSFYGPGNESKAVILIFAIGCVCFYRTNMIACAVLVNGKVRSYSAINSCVSFFVPFAMVPSKSALECCFWFSVINIVLFFLFNMFVIKSSHLFLNVKNSTDEFSFKKNVLPGLLGSTAVQLSQIAGQNKFMGGGIVGDVAGVFSVINQLKQLILFIPNSIYAILLSDLSKNKNNPSFIKKAFWAHIKISILMMLISFFIYLLAEKYGYLEKKYFLPTAIFIASFCGIVVTNFFSRFAQSLLKNIWAMMFDLFFSVIFFCGVIVFIESGEMLNYAIVMLVSVLAQLVFQLYWFFRISGK